MADQTTTIPKGWKMTTLGEIISSGLISNYNNKRFPLSSEERSRRKGKYPYYGAASAIDFIDDFKFNGYYLLIAEDGTVFDGKSPMLQLVNGKFWVSNHSHVLQGKDIETTKFLFYILKNVSIAPYITGAVQPKLTKENLYNISFSLPEAEFEQRAIAAVLSSFDDKIELLREQNKTLEAIAQAIFKEWFVNFNFPGATGKMIDSELGKIPEGWRVGKLVEEGVSELVKTNINNFKGTKDYVETANVNLSDFVGNFEKITYEKRPSRANMQPVSNSIWFARMAESRKYLLFQERDLQNIETKILSTGFAGIKCIKDYLYFYWCFILSDIFNDLKNQYAEGAVQVAISNGGIQKIMLVLPPEELAKKFAETVGSCFEKISSNNYQIQTLSKLRDTLLPKLMRGEIRVKGFKD